MIGGQYRAAARAGSGHRGDTVAGNCPFLAGGLAGHQGVAEAGDGGDDRGVAVAGDRMGGERNPGRQWVDHDLDQDGHRRTGPAPAVLVGGHPLGRGGGEAAPYRVGQAVHSDVEVRLVQAGVRGVRQIFRDRGGPYREPAPGQTRDGIGQPGPQPRALARLRGHHEAGRYREPRPGQLRQYRRLAAHARPAHTRGPAQVDDPAHDTLHR